MLAIKTINSHTLDVQPLRDGYQVITSDLLSSGSGRSAETGVTMRYLVRSNVYKLQLKFQGEVSKVASVLALIREFELTVEFYDPAITGGYVTARFYSGDPTFVPNGETATLSVNLIQI